MRPGTLRLPALPSAVPSAAGTAERDDQLGPDYSAWLARCRRRMARIDGLSPELRALVHEYGSTIVTDFVNCGVTEPRRIRHLVQRVLEGGAIGANSSPGALRIMESRCAELGLQLAGLADAETRRRCIDAFLRYSQPPLPKTYR